MFSRRSRSSLPGWVGCAPEGAQARLACVEQRAGQRPAVRWVHTLAFADPTGALRSLRRSHALAQRRCVALLSRGQYQMLPLDAPDVPREDWKAALRWQLKDLVEFPVDAASIDLLELPAAAIRGQAKVLAVAAPTAGLRPLAQAAEDAGMPWQAIDIPETALRNICALVETAGRAQALLQITAAGAQLVITLAGDLLLARAIDLPGAALAQDDDDARRSAFDRAGLELQRTLDSFERQFSAVTLSRLLLVPAAGVAGLADHLRELLYVPVELLDLADHLDLSEVPELADPALLGPHLSAIGAALRES
ncbi:MAG: type IV pilus biogenesis protein PilM [Aquabacterium sp.]